MTDDGTRRGGSERPPVSAGRRGARRLRPRPRPLDRPRAGREDPQPVLAQRLRSHRCCAAVAAARDARSSGAHPDDRDPQTMDETLGRFVSEQGWETELRVHGVFSRWEAIVGHDVGQHVTPESFADGRLVVRTDSTAWATQMKLLAPTSYAGSTRCSVRRPCG